MKQIPWERVQPGIQPFSTHVCTLGVKCEMGLIQGHAWWSRHPPSRTFFTIYFQCPQMLRLGCWPRSRYDLSAPGGKSSHKPYLPTSSWTTKYFSILALRVEPMSRGNRLLGLPLSTGAEQDTCPSSPVKAGQVTLFWVWQRHSGTCLWCNREPVIFRSHYF